MMTKTPRVEPTHVYVGRVPGCGCVEALRVDSPDDPKRTAKAVADMVRSGYEVTRVRLREVTHMQRCTHRGSATERGGLLTAAEE
jgi:hypothetical protein